VFEQSHRHTPLLVDAHRSMHRGLL
jgi:hypothetical protein